LTGIRSVRRPVVAANWKMHGSSATIAGLLDVLMTSEAGAAEVLILPPMPYLAQVVHRLRGTAISVGAQNIHPESAGAYTGETAAEMVKDLGATHVLVGHSERRQLFGETDVMCARKFSAARRAGLMPVLCVGETAAERDRGEEFAVVARQLSAVVDVVGIAAFETAIVAYEPVWAIGTGRSATAADAQAMHASIRTRFRVLDAAIADGLRILYGGSIKSDNAAALFAEADIDGGLVGGASLNAGQFMEICRAA
jgi:triosephosphate isomerase (TIM)